MSEKVSIRLGGSPQFLEAVSRLGKEYNSPSVRREISKAGAKFVAMAASRIAPQYKKAGEHYRYKTPKLVGRLRAPRGQGVKVATYRRGNLKKSIMDLADRRSKYKKLPVVILGPFYARSTGRGPFGTSAANADGYYAHMIFGSARAFQEKVMIAAMKSASTLANNEMLAKATQIFERQKAKQGLE